MPEGPEVRLVADVIERAVDKIFISAAVIENIPGKTHRLTKHPILGIEKLRDFKLTKVQTHGKMIVIHFQLADASPAYMLSTLGMSGSWGYDLKSHKHARFSLLKQDGDLTFVDARCFGTVRLFFDEDEVDAKLEKIGWDLLPSPAPVETWASFQKAYQIRNLQVGEALLYQDLFSGIGNIYKSESLYQCRIDPQIIVEELPEDKWAEINWVAHEIMQASYLQGGASVDSFSADGKPGNFQFSLQVYGQDACPVGHQVSTIKQGGRTTWFCKECLNTSHRRLEFLQPPTGMPGGGSGIRWEGKS